MHRFFVGANAFESSLVAKKDFRMETPASNSSKHTYFIFKKNYFSLLVSLVMNLKFLNLEIIS